ncbi:uncharacterized protein N7446_001062 [Penicillium canescens]|uniref:uncharacterized protein n=1 Tax=Penicillium canescens TaxID=5083 RepID=UPI0026DF2B8D|nr:uncharacterized protein N7446_001062 [Penicillium canescens]KAJ6078126.1 hypothetical protein N7446_001062 [Penicillium canescens]
MSSDEAQGYPVRRNNSCSAGESVCGRTWGTFYACCPGSSQCLDSHSTKINNFICCRDTLNCTGLLADTPTCANTSWDLYNSTGYFCCEPNHAGFSVQGTVSVGCVDPGAARNLSYSALKPSSTGTSSTTPTSTPTSIPTSSLGAGSSTSGHSSRTNAGAIGGGVAGGVVGAAAIIAALYLLIRYRKRQQPRQQSQSHALPSSLPGYALEKAASQPKELGNGHMPAELSDHSVNKRHELPS